MRNHWRFIKNAAANLGRGGAAAIIAVLLPPVLVRHMSAADYAVWVLVLQIGAYVNYLNFGLETAIGRYVAYSNEKKDIELRDSVFSTAFLGLCIAAVLSLACLTLVALSAHKLFPQVPENLLSQMRVALIIVGSALALGLPSSAWNGVFVGMARYEIPAMTVGGARLLSAAGIVIAVFAGQPLSVLALILASLNLLSYLAEYFAAKWVAPGVRFDKSRVRGTTARELYSYCLGLTVMSGAMLLVNGLDLVLVGRFQLSAIAPYSVAASIIALISGLLYAVINILLPHAASLHAREDATGLGKLVISSTALSVILLVLSGLPLLIYAGPIIRLWIGSQYVASGAPILAILIIANIIRLIGAPYSIVLVAAGQQSYIKISPVAEGLGNLIASLTLGAAFGAIGVAFGTLIGAFVGILAHLTYSIPRTAGAISLSPRQFMKSGILFPMLSMFPMLIVAALSLGGFRVSHLQTASAFAVSAVFTGILITQSKRIFKNQMKLDSVSMRLD